MQRWPHLATSSSSSLTGGDGSAAAAAASSAAIRPASAAAFAHLQPALQQVSKSFNYGVIDVASAGGVIGGGGIGGGGANISNGSFVPSVDAFNVSLSLSRPATSIAFLNTNANAKPPVLFFRRNRAWRWRSGNRERGQYKLDLGAAEFIRPSVRPSAAAAANIPLNAFRVRGVYP